MNYSHFMPLAVFLLLKAQQSASRFIQVGQLRLLAHEQALEKERRVFLLQAKPPLPNFVHEPSSLTGKVLKPGIAGGVKTDLDPKFWIFGRPEWNMKRSRDGEGRGQRNMYQYMKILGRPAKAACSCSSDVSWKPVACPRPQLGKGWLQGWRNPQREQYSSGFLGRGISQGCNTVTIQELKQRTRKQGKYQRPGVLEEEEAEVWCCKIAAQGIELGELTLAGMTRHLCTSREHINTVAITHEYTHIFSFPHGVKTFCNSLI